MKNLRVFMVGVSGIFSLSLKQIRVRARARIRVFLVYPGKKLVKGHP